MTKFELRFHGKQFAIPKVHLFNFFDHHPDLMGSTSYAVQSSVPLDVFQAFVTAVTTGAKIPLTRANADSLSLLAREFSLEHLLSEGRAFQPLGTPEFISDLSDRLCRLENQVFSECKTILPELQAAIENHDRQLEHLRSTFSALQSSPSVSSLSSARPANAEIQCPVQDGKSWDGIISYLTRTHDGNLGDKGIIKITSRTEHLCPCRNLLDLASDAVFGSKDEPNQWVCWDFGRILVRATHYRVESAWMKSWSVEGSIDGVNWTELDQQQNNSDLEKEPYAMTFPVTKSMESHFIRLIQKDRNRGGRHFLILRAFEVFGSLVDKE
jgi:hypothetical protein